MNKSEGNTPDMRKSVPIQWMVLFTLSVLTLLLFQCELSDTVHGKGGIVNRVVFDSTAANAHLLSLEPAGQWGYLKEVTGQRHINQKEMATWLLAKLPHIVENDKEGDAISQIKILADSTESDALRCNLYHRMGKISAGRGENLNAAGYFRTSLEIAQNLDEADMQVMALIGIASTCYNRLQYDSAIVNLEKGKIIAEQHRLESRIPDLYSNIANSKNLLGQNLEAVKMFVKAAGMYQARGDSNNLAIIYNNIGIIFLDMKRYQKAIEYFNLASTINEQNGNVEQLIINYGNIGLAYKNLDSIHLAKVNYLKSKELSEKNNDESELSRNFYNLGNLVIMEENYMLAEMYFDSAAYYCNKNNITYGLMLLDMARSALYVKEGKSQIAITTGLSALEKLKAYDMPYEMASMYKILYEAFKATGNLNKALYYFEKHVEISEKITSSESLKTIWDFENQYEKEKDARQISELENDVLRQQAQKKMMVVILAGVFLLLVAAVFLYVQTRRNSAIQAELERQRYENLKESMMAKGREVTGKALLIAHINEQLDLIRKKIVELTPHFNNLANESLQDLIRTIEKSRNTKAWDEFEENLAQVNSELYKKLLAIDPRLTPTELQICGLIAQNQNTKNIAALTNRSKQTIDNIRHSLRKKLNLSPDENLASFIHAL